MGCGREEEHLKNCRKENFVMARKSASPFYGLNNMLAVDEEEDEGGWGMVSSFPTNLNIEQVVK